MILWLADRLGISRALTIALLVVALLIGGFVTYRVWRGVHNAAVIAQGEQTTRSGDAISNASAAAIGIVTNAQDRDASIDNVTSETQKDIDNAPNASIGRDAVVSGVCRFKEYRNDPACIVR